MIFTLSKVVPARISHCKVSFFTFLINKYFYLFILNSFLLNYFLKIFKSFKYKYSVSHQTISLYHCGLMVSSFILMDKFGAIIIYFTAQMVLVWLNGAPSGWLLCPFAIFLLLPLTL